MILSIISILIEMVGVLIISKYGVPNKRLYDSVTLNSTLDKKESTKIFVMSQYGLILLVIGFSLQLFSLTLAVL